MALVYDGHFIIGGSPADRVSPNFRLREVTRNNGTVRIHRETLSALQILRDRFANGISVRAMRAKDGHGARRSGLFAWVTARDLDALTKTANKLVREGVLKEAAAVNDELFVAIGDPQALPGVSTDSALVTAVQVTSGFETSGDPFQQVTGNFDGAGMSFGPSQVNFGTGTLAPLFKKFIAADEGALAACFTNPSHYDEWRSLLRASKTKQIAWADANSTGRSKAQIASPWSGYLKAVGRVPRFRQLMVDHAKDKYGAKLGRAMAWLQDAGNQKIDHLRCISSLYDLCTQQGSLNKAHARIKRRIRSEPPEDQFDLVRIAVEERGAMANAPWRADCVSRRLGILYRQPTPAAVESERKTRNNRFFYLLRDVRVRNAKSLLP